MACDCARRDAASWLGRAIGQWPSHADRPLAGQGARFHRRLRRPRPLTAPELTADTAELAKATRKLKRDRPEADDVDLRQPGEAEPRAVPGLRAGQRGRPAGGLRLQRRRLYWAWRARELDKKALAWAQDHVRILSGLYGVLRPLDAIQPYRLEMGVRIKTRAGAEPLRLLGRARRRDPERAPPGPQGPRPWSTAPARNISAPSTARRSSVPVVTCRFLEEKDGEARIMSFFAKTARGADGPLRHRQPHRPRRRT